MIRLLQIIDSPNVGGAQEVILQLAKNIDRTQFSLQVVVLHGQNYFTDKLRDLAIPVFSLSKNKYNPAIFFKLLAFLLRNPVDVVHTNLFFSSLFGISASVLSGGKQQRFIWIHAHRAQLPWIDFPVYYLLSFFCRKIFAQVPTSAAEMRNVGISADKIKLIGIGFDPENLGRSESDLRAEFRIPRNATVISRVARFHPQKGVLELIDIMELVWKESPDTWLLLVGGGPQEQEILARIRTCSRPDRIAFTGVRWDLYNITACSDIVACTSSSEGLGMTNLAALFLGVPIVSYNVGAVALAVEDGKSGYLIPPSDKRLFAEKILLLLKNPDMRKAMGELSKLMASERFSITRMVRELEASYRSAVDSE